MTLVLALYPQHRDAPPQYVRLGHFPAVIGRRLDCAVIVADPYVGAQQLEIRKTETGYELCELGAVNATTLAGRKLSGGDVAVLKSGDVIELGQTRIEVYNPAHAVPAALPLPDSGAVGGWLARSFAGPLLLVLALALSALWSYVEVWSDEPAMTTAVAVTASFVIIVIWSALWSAAGRLMTHYSRFAAQLGAASLYVLASLVVSVALVYADYLTSASLASQIVTYSVHAVMLAALAYACLGLATVLPKRQRLLGAAYFSGGLVISVLCLSIVSARGFDAHPAFAATLEPYLSGLAPAQDSEAFLQDVTQLFDEVVEVSP